MSNARISNSLSYFLEQALILEKNSLETVSKISDAVTSQKDTVTLTLTDPNNPSNTIKYSIPSFGFLKSEIERLDNSIKTLYINNELVSLGNSKDVFYQDADPDDSIKYTLENDISSVSVKYQYKMGEYNKNSSDLQIYKNGCAIQHR